MIHEPLGVPYDGDFPTQQFPGQFVCEDSWPTNHGVVGHEKKMDLLVQDFVMLPNRWKKYITNSTFGKWR